MAAKRDKKSKGARRRPGGERVLEGLAVSPGVAVGEAFLREAGEIQVNEYTVSRRQVPAEAERFERAVAKAHGQLDKIRAHADNLHGTAAEELGYLLDAHEQMLSSARLTKGVGRRIEQGRINAEAAVMAEIAEIAANFEGMNDPYLAARADEIREVGLRLIRSLSDRPYQGFKAVPAGSVILAEEITPADTALMDPRRVGAFASVLGGAESHTAIMARSLGLPAVLGVAGLLEDVAPGETVIVDGSDGLVILRPTSKRIAEYRSRQEAMEREARALVRLRTRPAVTRDGVTVTLQANLELPREVSQARSAGAEGVGLLRTEFLYMNRDNLPGEEEQTVALLEIVRAMGGRPVTVRTLDVGGDKLAPSLRPRFYGTANPALGLRAIRLSLKEPELLETQLAAILRAGVEGALRILLPMISTVAEVLEVRKVLAATARRLRRKGVKIADPLPPLGVMIEIPGAALAADAIASVADFFAIGSNDLTMYTLAIDRGEESVAHLYNPLHPAVLRLIQFSVEAALRARLPVSVCGEIAGDPRFTPLLLGLGVRDLSMSANSLLRVKQQVRSLDMQAAARRAQVIMDQTDSGRIAALLDDFSESF
ncbi:MAG: phosphoenolpyruvate--protein phosphotransferase [Kiloniellales bacterium]|nr:phosphoenolpyruvate--protein phosphotransferase [Kiloniellales bacterium]